MSIEIYVAYPGLDGGPIAERVGAEVLTAATVTTPGTAELRRHLTFMPLGPGDIVEYDIAGRICGVVTLEPQFLVEVELPMPTTPLPAGQTFRSPDDPAYDLEKQLFTEWNRHAVVSSYTHFSCFVSSPSWDWLQANIVEHPAVEHVDVLRRPDFTLEFEVAIQNPDYSGDGTGPWT